MLKMGGCLCKCSGHSNCKLLNSEGSWIPKKFCRAYVSVTFLNQFWFNQIHAVLLYFLPAWPNIFHVNPLALFISPNWFIFKININSPSQCMQNNHQWGSEVFGFYVLVNPSFKFLFPDKTEATTRLISLIAFSRPPSSPEFLIQVMQQ